MVGLGPRDASEVIATAFAATGAQVAVVPLADGGPAFTAAVGELDVEVTVARPRSIVELLEILEQQEGRASDASKLWMDLTALAPFEWEQLVAVGPGVVSALAASLREDTLVGIVATGQESMTLTGLSGRVAERGREAAHELAETLAANDAVSAWLESLGADGAAPGSGAADGVGALVMALGGRVRSGIDALIDGFGVRATLARADLVVTGTSVLDFHAVGGDVVREVTQLANEALLPVIAIVGQNHVSARELRLKGIESAHAMVEGAGQPEPQPSQLAEVAGRVAQSWSW